MAKLQNYNGRYCEWEFEYTFLALLEEEGWQYLAGSSIPRNSRREVLDRKSTRLNSSHTSKSRMPSSA